MTPKTPRPKVAKSYTIEVKTPCGGGFFTVTFHNHKPFEVFCRIGKNGGCARASLDTLTTVISIGLRSGVDLADIIKTCRGVSCSRPPSWDNGEQVISCHDALGRALQEAWDLYHQEHGETQPSEESVQARPLRVA